MKLKNKEFERLLEDLDKGIKSDQHAFLAENFNEIMRYAKIMDSEDRRPWRLDALEGWIRLPKKLKVLKILKKNKTNKPSQPQKNTIFNLLKSLEQFLRLNILLA